ncbi:MAG: hypothetical protein M1817_005916 [Caeruleum heppii]|nr:MAG: hypothetical protein M1817_005916 [Caeruleum heppii]
MSLEAALDEERLEILKLLESPKIARPLPRNTAGATGLTPLLSDNGRNPSPMSARSPVRSMLDVDDSPPPARHASIAAPSTGMASSSRAVSGPTPIRSMLEPLSPPSTRSTQSGITPATASHPDDRSLHRTNSDASAHRPSERPRPAKDLDDLAGHRMSFNPNPEFQFEMLPSNPANALPLRVTQGGKRVSKGPSSMASVVRSTDLGGPQGRRVSEQNRNSMAGSVRSHGRSQSPAPRGLNRNSMNLMPNPNQFVNDSGDVVDLNNAYRRLSNANLIHSGGALSQLASRPTPEHIRADSGETWSPSGGVRLSTDDYSQSEGEEAAVTTDEDSDPDSSGEWGAEDRRGRKRSRRKEAGFAAEGESEDSDDPRGAATDSTLSMGRSRGSRKTMSLLAAADEEREKVSSKYTVKSLLSPSLTVTGPGSERSKRLGVHPTTSFDQGGSGVSTPVSSDTEADISDIRRAQRMNVSISPINSTPESHRAIRTIIRGEFSIMQQQADEGTRRQRTYLVATDLSDEATHALEWTIGTVLRDGDTLLAVYAVDEETGTGKAGEGEGIGIGEGALAVKDQAAMIGSLTAKAHVAPPALSPLGGGGGGPNAASLSPAGNSSTSASPDSRQRSKTEQERIHAAEDISQRCVRLLRKTKLQVRVVIEVIHCKSPKHLLTEVIDFIDPTLVILGSRGRSALKGVLLGSFSNYLVTKSSVPVMVARKRLRKHSKKFNTTNVRLSNNLTPAKSLASAKVDELTRY